MKPVILYSINRDYTRLDVFLGSRMTQQVRERIVIRPKQGLTREDRYAEIARHLRMFDIPVPVFRPTNKRA